MSQLLAARISLPVHGQENARHTVRAQLAAKKCMITTLDVPHHHLTSSRRLRRLLEISKQEEEEGTGSGRWILGFLLPTTF
ncbi:unnamed protein product [Caenorhabditis auriculariae]|uniref:Uncharacterized protein n=1 Tax=Caenorhabditis auriculariae TaxID=2777116 RepID=A0A8S1GQU8_9PELO|nr:unnamed protein product [Caenorhabditis auriculariae]